MNEGGVNGVNPVNEEDVGALQVEYADQKKEYGILFIFSLLF